MPLARLKQRVFTTADTLDCDVEIYHFGEKPLTGAKPYWKITAVDGSVLASGMWDARTVPIGKNIPLGHVKTALASLPAPAACKLVIGLEGTAIENDWNFWLYPDKSVTPATDDVIVSDNWTDAAARLAEGGKVLFTPKELDPSISPPMRNTPVFWNIQMTVRPPKNRSPRFDAMLGLLCDPKHPALASFPTDRFCDWQWTSIVHGVRSVNLTSAPRDLQPIVSAIDDWNRNWRLGVIFEARVGKGRLLVSAVPLEKTDPVTRQLRVSLTNYAASKAFQPSATLKPEQAGALFATGNGKPATPTRQFDPDLDDGSGKK